MKQRRDRFPWAALTASRMCATRVCPSWLLHLLDRLQQSSENIQDIVFYLTRTLVLYIKRSTVSRPGGIRGTFQSWGELPRHACESRHPCNCCRLHPRHLLDSRLARLCEKSNSGRRKGMHLRFCHVLSFLSHDFGIWRVFTQFLGAGMTSCRRAPKLKYSQAFGDISFGRNTPGAFGRLCIHPRNETRPGIPIDH